MSGQTGEQNGNENKNGLQHWAIAASFLGLVLIAAVFMLSELDIAHVKDICISAIIFGAAFGAVGVVLGIICWRLAAGWVAIAVGAICVAILLTLLLRTSAPGNPHIEKIPSLGKQDNAAQLSAMKADLPLSVVMSLKSGDISHAVAFVMDEEKWRSLADIYGEALPESMSFADLASRSRKGLEDSFTVIREGIRKEGIDWTEAKLTGIKMRSPGSDEWVDYSPDCREVRIDINLGFETLTTVFVVKLDDCYLINDERYLGDGLKLPFLRDKQ